MYARDVLCDRVLDLQKQLKLRVVSNKENKITNPKSQIQNPQSDCMKKYKLTDLKKIAKDNNRQITGNKPALCDRLRDVLPR